MGCNNASHERPSSMCVTAASDRAMERKNRKAFVEVHRESKEGAVRPIDKLIFKMVSE